MATGLLLVQLAVAAPAPVQPQAPSPPAVAAVQQAPAPASVRNFGADELQRLQADDDLHYQEAPPPTNPVSRWWQNLMRRLFDSLPEGSGAVVWRVLIYGVAAVALVLIVMQLLNLRLSDWLRGRGRNIAVPYATEADDVHEQTLPQRLQQAEAQGQWRLATRLGYLLVLKALTDRGLINWTPDKTNHHYQAELQTNAARLVPAFASLTRQFEYVWYGELELEAAPYEQVRTTRQAFLTHLQNRRAA
ncbi:hypothetical protein ASU33_05815 [Solirubrum puertoriconensis]|uniref:Protein-glutamine gamma-glutamyltransferase-like C-terminal domain-containing protein n=1 Tax=Solirubrum puertoriconensis TaxID=1751427 RepID=A0A9X0HJ52_SOLP1|nr:hypothetical protein ASU33_05815 [Solirubrum puertoriconensis]